MLLHRLMSLKWKIAVPRMAPNSKNLRNRLWWQPKFPLIEMLRMKNNLVKYALTNIKLRLSYAKTGRCLVSVSTNCHAALLMVSMSSPRRSTCLVTTSQNHVSNSMTMTLGSVLILIDASSYPHKLTYMHQMFLTQLCFTKMTDWALKDSSSST